MSTTNTPQKTERGWVVGLPPEIAQALNVAEGSVALLHAGGGRLEFEILPPLTPELSALVRESYEESREALEEMKRLGDMNLRRPLRNRPWAATAIREDRT